MLCGDTNNRFNMRPPGKFQHYRRELNGLRPSANYGYYFQYLPPTLSKRLVASNHFLFFRHLSRRTRKLLIKACVSRALPDTGRRFWTNRDLYNNNSLIIMLLQHNNIDIISFSPQFCGRNDFFIRVLQTGTRPMRCCNARVPGGDLAPDINRINHSAHRRRHRSRRQMNLIAQGLGYRCNCRSSHRPYPNPCQCVPHPTRQNAQTDSKLLFATSGLKRDKGIMPLGLF